MTNSTCCTNRQTDAVGALLVNNYPELKHTPEMTIATHWGVTNISDDRTSWTQAYDTVHNYSINGKFMSLLGLHSESIATQASDYSATNTCSPTNWLAALPSKPHSKPKILPSTNSTYVDMVKDYSSQHSFQPTRQSLYTSDVTRQSLLYSPVGAQLPFQPLLLAHHLWWKITVSSTSYI